MNQSAQLKKAPLAQRVASVDDSLATKLSEPANDARPKHAFPAFVLTDETRAKLAAEGARIDSAALRPLPAYTIERLRWMGGVLVSAWADQDALALVAVGGGKPVSVAELHDFGHRLAYALETVCGGVNIGSNVTAVTPGRTDEAVRDAMRAAQVKLCDAIPVWFEGKTGEDVARAKRKVSEVKRATANKRVAENTVKVLSVVDEHAELEAWLRTLPLGEGAALDTLRETHPDHVRRESIAAHEKTAKPGADASLRAWALLAAPLRRILVAGRYLTKGRPDRKGAYAAFSQPRKPRPRKVKVVAPVTAPVHTPA